MISGWKPKTWPTERRLALAIAASLAAHLLAVFGGMISLPGHDEPLEQLQMQLRLAPPSAPAPQPATPAPAEPATPAKPATTQEGQLAQDGPSPNKVAAKGQAASAAPQAAGEARPPAPPTEAAVRVEDAAAPVYPDDAIAQKLQGCVLAAVHVNEAGDVARVEIVQADVPGVFDQSVVDSQSRAHYLPARQGGKNVPSMVLAVVGFTLDRSQDLNCPQRYAPLATRLLGRKTP